MALTGVIAKPYICAPVVYNSRLRSRVSERSQVATNLPFFRKTTFPSSTLKSSARVLQASSISAPCMETRMDKLLYNPLHSPAKRAPCPPRALSSHPSMTEKPKWWWRSLAGLPYLLTFQERYMYWALAHPMNNPSPFLENYDNFFFPLQSAFNALPTHLLALYPIILYFWVVKREEMPHFFRFHLMMAILIGGLVQAIGISSNWLPTWAYPPHFWSIATVLFLVTVLDCISCALNGRYSRLPFVKDAAFMHLDLKL